jgi:cystathionine beta-lyase
MKYDFDTVIDRNHTNCLKYDFKTERGMEEDVLPLWVADMDFQTLPEIRSRLQEVVSHGIFGYSDGKEDYFTAVQGWYARHFGWEIKKEWLIKTPGVVYAIAAAVAAYTNEGDAVLIQQPVYYPFGQMIRENKRKLVNNPLQQRDGHYEIDFADFEQKIVEHHVKLFLLCSPHNPVGRVFEEWELKKLGDICIRHHVIVLSDEIHSDFTYPGHTHHVFASLGEVYANQCVICTAPSKTFNLAGLQISNILIPNEKLRHAFESAVTRTGYSQAGIMGLVATQAAYEHGDEWVAELKAYLYENLNFVREYLKENLPQIRLIEPEGTYLLWLDFGGLGLTEKELEELVVKKAKLWLDRGAVFGAEGRGFERINIACPRSTLKQALDQLKNAIS